MRNGSLRGVASSLWIVKLHYYNWALVIFNCYHENEHESLESEIHVEIEAAPIGG